MLHSNWNFIYTAKANAIIVIWELFLRFCEADKIANLGWYIQCPLYIRQFHQTKEFCILNVSILQIYVWILFTIYTILTCRILACKCNDIYLLLDGNSSSSCMKWNTELCCENESSAECLQAWMLRKTVARHWVTSIKLNMVSCRRKVDDLYTQTWHGGLSSLT